MPRAAARGRSPNLPSTQDIVVSHPSRRLAALALALAGAVAAFPLGAQERSAAGALANPSSLADLAGATLAPGSWSYASTVTRGTATVELARRTLSVRAAEHGGAPAWLILDETSARGQSMTDSLLVARADLRPLRRVADMGPMRIVLGFAGDSVRGTMTVPGGGESTVALATSGGAPVVANSGMLESALTLLPLRAGWRGEVLQLAPSPMGTTLVPISLLVTGEEEVTVPAGTFDTWVLTASAGGAEQRLWVAKEGGRLVQQVATPPHAGDVEYRTVLVAAPAR